MRRYTKREVSRLLGEVMRGNPVSMLSFNLARVVRQMRRDLAGRTWRPIASAPRDGTKVLCWSRDSGCFIARFDGTYWLVGIGAIVEPTHWMPLPDGPVEG